MPSAREKQPIVIMGPNASGKTSLALTLAKKTGAEIISADSRQIYTHLQAGTSKPEGRWETAKDEKKYLVEGAPYHLVDFVDPLSSYNAGEYLQDASELLRKITEAGGKTVIAGGTGMYIHALFNGLDELPKADEKLRGELLAFAELEGRPALHERLAKLDPVSAAKIPPNNIQRVMRALEISLLSGKPASSLMTGKLENQLPYHSGVFVVLKWTKDALYERIRSRTADCFDLWTKETETLLANGYPYDCPGLKSLGYPQVIDFIQGRSDKKAAIDQIVKLSMDYAKRQNTWFARYRQVKVLEFSANEEFNPEKLAEEVIKEARA